MCFFNETNCVSEGTLMVTGFLSLCIFLPILIVPGIVRKHKANSENMKVLKPLPIEGSVYDFIGTCPARLLIDSVDREKKSVMGTLVIQLPPGAKQTGFREVFPNNEDDDQEPDAYYITYQSTDGGGGMYKWDWNECTWPSALDDCGAYVPNLKILPG